jgi:16S rRNA G966 N2-methylase RsmD
VTAIGAQRYLGTVMPGRFDIVFLDPPFALDLTELMPKVWPHVAAGGLIYCEQALERGLPALPEGEWIKTAKAGAVCFGLARP